MDYIDYIEFFLRKMHRNAEKLEIGINISHIKELKIIFDGYGYDEENDEEGADINTETYAVFIHKDALKPGFAFPEHTNSGWSLLIHRPSEEVYIGACYDVEMDSMHVNEPTSELTYEQGLSIIKALYERYAE